MRTTTIAVPVRMPRAILALILLIAAMWLPAPPAAAQLLQDLDAQARDDGSVELHIRLAATARYLRHFPYDQGQIVQLYLQLASLDDVDIVPDIPNYRVLAATGGMPRVTVTLADPDADNVDRRILRLIVQFDKPVSFDIQDSPDGRGVVMHVRPAATPATPGPAATTPTP